MVRIAATYHIDHEIKAKFQEILGKGNTSNDLEQYMKSVIDEKEKIKNFLVVPDQETTNIPSELSSSNSNSNLKSVTLQHEGITLDVLNTPKSELSVNLERIDDIKALGRVQGTAHMVETIARIRIQKLRA
jgi:hypothetical protein